MDKFDFTKKQIDDLISQHIEELLDSHFKYGGVYACIIKGAGIAGEDSLEVELNEGVIAFTLSVSPEHGEEILELLDEALRSGKNGRPQIGVYRDRSNWEEALVE